MSAFFAFPKQHFALAIYQAVIFDLCLMTDRSKLRFIISQLRDVIRNNQRLNIILKFGNGQ